MIAALIAQIMLVLTSPLPAGWQWVAPSWTAPTERVAVVGDSLIYQAEHGSIPDPFYLTHRFTDQLNGRGWATRVAAASGRTTDSLRLWGRWASPPTTIVMALGTNDNYFDVDLDVSIGNVQRYTDRWPDACVVYVGVVPSAPRRIDDTAPGWNDRFRAEAARTGGTYLDWPAVVAAHPDYVGPDGLHHTAAGQAAYRQWITETVAACGTVAEVGP